MQGYQIYATVTRDDCCLIHLHTTVSTTSTSAVGDWGDCIVPTPPGHARIPNAYPPNRRRQR